MEHELQLCHPRLLRFMTEACALVMTNLIGTGNDSLQTTRFIHRQRGLIRQCDAERS